MAIPCEVLNPKMKWINGGLLLLNEGGGAREWIGLKVVVLW
jgi:hypothetical protein